MLLRNLTDIFYPKLCLSCKDELTMQENVTCVKCSHDLPVTGFTNQPENLVEKLFHGRVSIEEATALFYFQKLGSVQRLIHQLKYKGAQQIGGFFGDWLGRELLLSSRFKHIDCVVPVPLHKDRLKQRGYNQLTEFGKSISNLLGVPYDEEMLMREKSTETQTHKHRQERWENVFNIFNTNKLADLKEKNILLIDDIITTGATIEACCKALNKSEKVKISVACMAITV